jgi:hypothetical protein
MMNRGGTSPLNKSKCNYSSAENTPRHRGRMTENQLRIERDRFIAELNKLTSTDEKRINAMMA